MQEIICKQRTAKMEINFKGKRALVTGAGKGIGRATAKALVKCGADVIALTRTQADLDTLIKEVPSIKPLCIDLQNTEEAVKVIEQQGDIHLLVNNAAVMPLATFMDIETNHFDELMNINVKSQLFIAQAVVRKMISKGCRGSIVNVSSQASTLALPGLGLYCCSKAALDMMTKVMALELGPYKIRVNSVNPCLVTGTRIADIFKKENEDFLSAYLSRIPLGHYPGVDDVVNAILYLLSDQAAMVNGVNLLINGGSHVC